MLHIFKIPLDIIISEPLMGKIKNEDEDILIKNVENSVNNLKKNFENVFEITTLRVIIINFLGNV